MKYILRLWAYLCLLPLCELPAQIVINEFYSDVAIGLVGDANGDGIRNATEDEFIELVNVSDTAINVYNFSIWVSGNLKHKFEDDLLVAPKAAIVVFGGGAPIGDFGESSVVVASSGSLGLGNNGVQLELKNDTSNTIEEFTYPDANINTSWARFPDLTGGFKSHDQISTAYGLPFSPGTMLNSFPFGLDNSTYVHFPKPSAYITEGDSIYKLSVALINPANRATTFMINRIDEELPEDLRGFENIAITYLPGESGQKHIEIPITDDLVVEGLEVFKFIVAEVQGGNNANISINQAFTLLVEDNDFDFPLLLNEIHADPALSLDGDANQDGFRDAKEDEFLEFVNTSDQAIDVSGFQLFDEDALRHIIPEGTVVNKNQAFVVFGGGFPSGDYGSAIVQTASTGSLNLLNNGDKITIRDTTGAVLYSYAFKTEAANNQSITRFPDLGDGLINILHSTVGNLQLFSPGKRIDGSDFSELVAINTVEEVLSLTIFPNPATSYIQLFSSKDLLINSVELVNNSGMLIWKGKPNSGNSIPLNVSGGIYFIKVTTSAGIFNKRIVIE